MTLPSSLPHKELFERFMQEYRSCTTYWYVPKARTLGDDYVAQCTKILTIITEHFLGFRWNRETQSALRKRAVDDGSSNPLVDDASEQDQNALIRINKTLLETLGLLWVQDNDEILLTDAGAALLAVRDNDEERKAIVSAQVAKLQYPNPSMSKQNRETFGGIVPYLFLLDVLNRVGGTITYQEFELFLNLASRQEDVSRITSYIEAWRTLSQEQRSDVLHDTERMLMAEYGQPVSMLLSDTKNDTGTRSNRIGLDGSYQPSILLLPSKPLDGRK